MNGEQGGPAYWRSRVTGSGPAHLFMAGVAVCGSAQAVTPVERRAWTYEESRPDRVCARCDRHPLALGALPQSVVAGRPGWTVTAVTRFLGDPEHRRPNPRGARAAPMKMFAVFRVLAVEATEEFTRFGAGSAVRSASASRAAETCRAELLDYVARLKVHVPPVTLRRARAAAIDSYNDRAAGRGRDGGADLSSDPEFLDRITVNWIRHEHMDDYELNLERIYGRTGVAAAYTLLRAKVMDAIARAVPELARACRDQR